MMLLMSLLLLVGAVHRPPVAGERFESITDDSDGKWVVVWLTTDTAEDEIDGNTFYGCESEDNVSRSVCFKGRVDLDERFAHLVRGKLRVIHHGPGFIDEKVIPGFTEYRLEQAKLIE